MDAITMLKDDHKKVEQLFKRFENAGDRAHIEKRNIVDRIIEELSVHAAVEEQLFYPVVRATVPGTEDVTLESLEEHNIVKWVLSDLDSMSPEDERFDAKVTVLIENVRHHVDEEESELFPKVRDELGRSALGDLGDALAEAKKTAPTHPHPRSPDTPPGNVVVGAAAGVADRIGDTVSGLAQGGVSVLADLIATVLRRKKPRTSPQGSKVTRDTAERVRSGAADATEAAIEAARNAKRTGERAVRTTRATASSAQNGAKRTARAAKQGGSRTARAAKSGAKGTATSARRSAKRTTTTAKRAATTTRGTARSAAKGTATSARRSAKRTTTTAKRAATTTRRTARSAAKGTATSARRSAKRTTTTAKRAATTTRGTANGAAKSTASTAKRSARQTASTASSSS
jgi:hemerythrin-like domain-containing protein